MVAYTYYPPLLLISPPECLTTSSSITAELKSPSTLIGQ